MLKKTTEYTQLRRMVKEAGLLKPRPYDYAWRIGLHGLAYVIFLSLAINLGDSWWSLLIAPPLAIINLQLMLYVHDVAHRAAFKSPWFSRFYALLIGNFLNGMGLGWWNKSHNTHHAESWHEDKDPDLKYPCFALTHTQVQNIEPLYQPILRHQHLLAWPLMALVSINIKLYTFQWLIKNPHKKGEILALIAGRLWHAYILLFLFNPAIGLSFAAVQLAVFGFISGVLTSTNHWGMPVRRGEVAFNFLREQVETSRNITGSWWIRYIYGGLDMQIEHHLFPNMPRTNLRKASSLVQPFCLSRGVTYEALSMKAALGSVYGCLRENARLSQS